MTRQPCKYCGQEERYGHNAPCVMNTVEDLRAEVERLKAEVAEWKERWAAERRDHETTIRHFDELMNEEM